MAYVAIKNFKDGEKLNWKHYKVGQAYDGKNVDQFLKAGLIKDGEAVAEESNKSIEQQMADHKAKYEALKKQLIATKKSKPATEVEDPKTDEKAE